MTVDELVEIVEDAIDASVEATPPGLSDAELEEFLEERRVHSRVKACRGWTGTARQVASHLFSCSARQWDRVVAELGARYP